MISWSFPILLTPSSDIKICWDFVDSIVKDIAGGNIETAKNGLKAAQPHDWVELVQKTLEEKKTFSQVKKIARDLELELEEKKRDSLGVTDLFLCLCDDDLCTANSIARNLSPLGWARITEDILISSLPPFRKDWVLKKLSTLADEFDTIVL